MNSGKNNIGFKINKANTPISNTAQKRCSVLQKTTVQSSQTNEESIFVNPSKIFSAIHQHNGNVTNQIGKLEKGYEQFTKDFNNLIKSEKKASEIIGQALGMNLNDYRNIETMNMLNQDDNDLLATINLEDLEQEVKNLEKLEVEKFDKDLKVKANTKKLKDVKRTKDLKIYLLNTDIKKLDKDRMNCDKNWQETKREFDSVYNKLKSKKRELRQLRIRSDRDMMNSANLQRQDSNIDTEENGDIGPQTGNRTRDLSDMDTGEL